MTANNDFAATLTELEQLVSALDSDIPIEKALELFERGMKLSSQCEKFLSSAEQKVEVLKKLANGNVETELYVPEPLDISNGDAIS